MIEQHVTSLELSKKLNELEINSQSLFYWEFLDEKSYGVHFMPYCIVPSWANDVKLYPAYLSSELMGILPNHIDTKKNEPFNVFKLRLEKFTIYENDEFKGAYSCSYVCDTISDEHPFPGIFHSEWDLNPSNALAKMAIFLKESNLWNG